MFYQITGTWDFYFPVGSVKTSGAQVVPLRGLAPKKRHLTISFLDKTGERDSGSPFGLDAKNQAGIIWPVVSRLACFWPNKHRFPCILI